MSWALKICRKLLPKTCQKFNDFSSLISLKNGCFSCNIEQLGKKKKLFILFWHNAWFSLSSLIRLQQIKLNICSSIMHLKIDSKSILKATVSYHDFLDSFVTLPLNCQFNTKEKFYRVQQKFRYGRNKSWNFLENSIVLDSLLVAAIKTGYFLWLGSVSVIPS